MQEPLIYDFQTESGNYYTFDGCTGGVYSITEVDLEIIRSYKEKSLTEMIRLLGDKYDQNTIKKSFNKVKNWIDIDKAFYPVWEQNRKDEFMSEKEYMNKLANSTQMILELTQACNLRCKYCPYGDSNNLFRHHNSQHMTWDIAKKSIDYYVSLINSSNRTNPLAQAMLSFYGGESLLRFPLMMKCVKYIKNLHTNDDVRFGLTTNGVLLNDKIIKFLIENEFSLTISLDGPASENDKNRVTVTGEKTFSNIWDNIKKIKKLDGEYFKKFIRFNAVFTPFTNFKNVADFFCKKSPYVQNALVSFKPVDKIGIDYKDIYGMKNIKYFNKQLQSLKKTYYYNLQNKINMKNTEMKFLKLMFEGKHETFKKRLNRNPENAVFLGASCTPGEFRIFVATDGTYHMCEKINTKFPIGDHKNGISYDKIREIFVKFGKSVLYKCSNCLISTQCPICPSPIANVGNFQKIEYCEKFIEEFKKFIVIHHSTLEKNPEAFGSEVDLF